MQVVESPFFRAVLDVPEALGFPREKLRLILDWESLLLHLHEILTAEFTVMPDAPDLKAFRAALLVPHNHVVVIGHLVIGHVQPAVLQPAEQRDLILLCFNHRGRTREPAVRNDDVYALVVPEQGAGCQVVELGQIRPAIPPDRQFCQLRKRPAVPFVAFTELRNVEPRLNGICRNI